MRSTTSDLASSGVEPPVTGRGRDSRGFSLLEVMVAVALLSLVLLLAFTQIDECLTAAKSVTADADLRRIGQDVLARIAQDLRSTQALDCSIDATGQRLELARIVGFDAATAAPLLETQGGGPVYTLYDGTGVTSDGQNGVLALRRTSAGGTIVQTDLTRELAPSGGFVVRATSPDGFAPVALLDAGGCFHDEPVALALELVLQRQLGIVRDSSGVLVPDVVRTVLETRVQVRPSASYR